MAWMEIRKLQDGTETYWVRDKRDGRQIVILVGHTSDEAYKALVRYNIRHSIEKHGYDDKYTST
jgi:hypothetical protein